MKTIAQWPYMTPYGYNAHVSNTGYNMQFVLFTIQKL